MDEARVANAPAQRVTDENRVSMELPNLMLQVPEIEGHVLHWFADRPGRIGRALAAGYQFVAPDEVKLNNFSLAGDVLDSGNTDLGSRISVHGGEASGGGGSERLYLMKIKQEWYDKDMALREQASERVVNALKGGDRLQGAVGDVAHRYTRHSENLFTKKSQKATP